jgi:taurine dioxygenase
MIEIRKLTSNIGAEISGVDLSKPMTPELVAEIRRALLDNIVIFFRGQKLLDDDEFVRLGQYFGTLIVADIQTSQTSRPEISMFDQVAPKGQSGDSFHRDLTHMEAPPMGAILQQVVRPETGGDTCWASMYAAYDALSPAMQNFLDGLYARHSVEPVARSSALVRETLGEKMKTMPISVHPAVEVHPETGRKALNINRNWTLEFTDLTREESELLLGFLLNHVTNPDFQVRFSWQAGDIAFWDNRCSQHFAVADYTTRRVMRRVALAGSKPVGPREAQVSRAA